MNEDYSFLVLFSSGEKMSGDHLLRKFSKERIQSMLDKGYIKVHESENNGDLFAEDKYSITAEGIQRRDEWVLKYK